MHDRAGKETSLRARIELLEKELRACKDELTACKAENARLSDQAAFLSLHPTIALGMKYVSMLAELTGLPKTTGNAPYDIGDEISVEVKSANLTPNGGGNTWRWTWGKVFGQGGRKKYDRLILVGAKDARHVSTEPSGDPYVFFDVPYDHVRPLINDGGEAKAMIRISRNPQTVRSETGRLLFNKYQVTAEEIESAYKLRRP